MKKNKIKLFLLSLFSISIINLVVINHAFGKEKLCPDPACDDPISQYAQSWLNEMKNFYKDGLDKAGNIDYKGLEACLAAGKKLANLDSIFDKFDFSIILPNIEELISKACYAILSEIRQYMNELESKLVSYIPYDGKLDFNDFSNDIANSALDKIFDKSGTLFDNAINRLPQKPNMPGLDDIPLP